MAPKAKIMAIQVFHRVDSAEDCAPLAAPCTLASTSDLLAAFDYILGEVAGLAEPLAAINMSVGGGEGTGPCNDTPLARVVQSLRARGVATVFSAGNSGFRNSTNDGTSCVEAAFSIGATTKDDLVSPFSNMSPIVSTPSRASASISPFVSWRVMPMWQRAGRVRRPPARRPPPRRAIRRPRRGPPHQRHPVAMMSADAHPAH